MLFFYVLLFLSCVVMFFLMTFSYQLCCVLIVICFFKQKTAYEMRISDWSSDVCSSDLQLPEARLAVLTESEFYGRTIGSDARVVKKLASRRRNVVDPLQLKPGDFVVHATNGIGRFVELSQREVSSGGRNPVKPTREYVVLEYAPSKRGYPGDKLFVPTDQRSEEPTYELQSLKRIMYAVFALKTKKK